MSPPDPNTSTDSVTESSVTPARRLEEVLDPVAATMGFEIVLLEWLTGSRRRIMRVYLDHPEGVSLDVCARMSRLFGNALEAAEGADATMARILADPYNLEVSSPGLERPLTRRTHFQRHVGQLARVRLHAPLGPQTRQRTFKGTIDATEPDPERPEDDRAGTVMLRESEQGPIHRIPMPAIRRANLVYEG